MDWKETAIGQNPACKDSSLSLVHHVKTYIINSYVFAVHGKGPAVGDFGFQLSPDDSTTSSNISIRDNEMRRIKCWTTEVPGM